MFLKCAIVKGNLWRKNVVRIFFVYLLLEYYKMKSPELDKIEIEKAIDKIESSDLKTIYSFPYNTKITTKNVKK